MWQSDTSKYIAWNVKSGKLSEVYIVSLNHWLYSSMHPLWCSQNHTMQHVLCVQCCISHKLQIRKMKSWSQWKPMVVIKRRKIRKRNTRNLRVCPITQSVVWLLLPIVTICSLYSDSLSPPKYWWYHFTYYHLLQITDLHISICQFIYCQYLFASRYIVFISPLDLVGFICIKVHIYILYLGMSLYIAN